MSHDGLAELWSVFHRLQDVTIAISIAVGRLALDTALLPANSGTCINFTIRYAIELSTVYDYIRASNVATSYSDDIRSAGNQQQSICSSLVYMFRSIRASWTTGHQTAKQSTDVFLRTTLSAISALRCIAAEYPIELEHVAAAAHELNEQLSESQEELEALKALCSYLTTQCTARAYNERNSTNIKLGDTVWTADPTAVSNMIENLVNSATDSTVSYIDRMETVLEIYDAYWASEAFLIASCGTVDTRTKYRAPKGYIEGDIAAMFVRPIIQENLICAHLETPMDPWPKLLGCCIMFTPSLGQACSLDTCQCAFDNAVAGMIFEMRKERNRSLHLQLPRFYKSTSQCQTFAGLPGASFADFASCLQCLEDQRPPKNTNRDDVIDHDFTPPVSNELQQSSISGVAEVPSDGITTSSESRRLSQHISSQHFTQPDIFDGRTTAFAIIDGATETAPQASAQHARPFLLTSRRQPSSNSNQVDDSTTNTSSSSSRRHIDSIVSPLEPGYDSHDENYESHKIVVEAIKSPTEIYCPLSLEKSFPEVVIRTTEPDMLSITSDHSIPKTIYTARNPLSRSKWGNILKGRKDAASTFHVPRFRFFASGKHIILWTKYGGGIIDTRQLSTQEFTQIHEADIVHAAGGTECFVVISRIIAESYRMSVYRLGSIEKANCWDLQQCPQAIDFACNDRYLALKYTRYVHLYDLEHPKSVINHRLVTHDKSQPGLGNHLVSFAHDSQSFMAATRFQPERVYTYWAQCARTENARGIVATSSAPCGHVEDHGLSSLIVYGPTQRSSSSGFLSTYTEKGYPVFLNMNPQKPFTRLLRDHKEQIGTRIHGAAMSVDPMTDKANLVIMNQNNQIYWMTDIFGHDTETRKIATLKRNKSLRSDVEIAMSDVDEASVFWIDKQTRKGVLVRVGRRGGLTDPVAYRLDIDPLCGG